MRIIVVDDEPMMRDVYKTLIDWQANGFTFVGSAHNGEAALALMRRKGADIVITDLKMPVMSGLELIRVATEEFPQTKFIAMSGYDDFYLVSEAYKLGVKEYFLKMEMDTDSIVETLFKVKKEIEKEREELNSRLSQPEFFRKLHQMNLMAESGKYANLMDCEKILKNMIWGTDNARIKKQLSEKGLTINESNMSLMVLSVVDYYKSEEETWKGEREIFKYAILNVLNEICERYENMYPFSDLPHQFVVVYAPNGKCACREFVNEVREAMEMCFELEIDCGISGPVSCYADLKNIYQNAKSACEYSFVSGHGSAVFYSDIPSDIEINVSENVSDFRKLFSTLSPEDIKSNAYRFRVSPNLVGIENIDKVKNLFYLYYIEMLRFLKENELSDTSSESLLLYNSIKDRADLSRMNTWLIQSVNDIANMLNGRSGVSKAKKYIEKHFAEQISLNTVASLLEMSPGYFSRIFQKEVGINFTQYLLNVRMNEAAHLLKNTNLKIYEVALRVGYTNADQFSRMFKKTMGKSPKEFQN